MIAAERYYLTGTLPDKIYWLLPYLPRVDFTKNNKNIMRQGRK
jgi:hypothetical protein